MPDLTPYRKLVVAVVGAVAQAVTLGLVPDSVGSWLAVVVAFITALGVYGLPNNVKIRPNGLP